MNQISEEKKLEDFKNQMREIRNISYQELIEEKEDKRIINLIRIFEEKNLSQIESKFSENLELDYFENDLIFYFSFKILQDIENIYHEYFRDLEESEIKKFIIMMIDRFNQSDMIRKESEIKSLFR